MVKGRSALADRPFGIMGQTAAVWGKFGHHPAEMEGEMGALKFGIDATFDGDCVVKGSP